MKPRLVGTVFSSGLAALLAGALAAVPAAAASTAGLHVVASPFINNSCLSGAAVIGASDMWAVGDIDTGTFGCNPFQTVGTGSGGGPFQTLAEHFNGTSWSVVPTPALKDAALSGVAGAAGNNVWAVGDQAEGSSFNTLIEHWDGTSWTVVPGPKLPKDSALTGVTAPATNNAWAVGFTSGSTALVEHWDGTSWSIVSSRAFTGVSISAGAVSADSSTDVWAMGFLATGSTTAENVSLHWNGTSWSQIPAAHLRSGGVGPLSALSPANVWAVGTGPGAPTGGFSAHPTAVIEHWDGTSWSVVPSPNPNPSGNNSLGAVAAVSANDVWAVGLQLQGPFTEHWDGTSWSIISAPGGVRFFGGMAASSGGTVLAVGQGTNGSGIILSN
jgi:hypothetical protein